jgi:hypothetical protein
VFPLRVGLPSDLDLMSRYSWKELPLGFAKQEKDFQTNVLEEKLTAREIMGIVFGV